MLLDDTNQLVIFGHNQVITYDQLDEHYSKQFQHTIWKNLPREIFIYDSMVQETKEMLRWLKKELDKHVFQPMLGRKGK